MKNKGSPTYDLSAVKAVLGDASSLAITTSALIDAVALGFDRAAVAEVIQGLNSTMFYKSMPTHADPALWQDVYHAPVDDGLILYVKFQADVVTAFKLISFKEK